MTDKLQRVLNAAARVVSDTRKFDRGLSAVRHYELHWLDIPERIIYKLGVMTYGCQHGKAPRQCLTLLVDSVTVLQSSSSCRSTTPAEYIRPTGFFCHWPVCLELSTGRALGSGH